MDEDAYIDALIRDLAFDLETHAIFIGQREIRTIFFGGGTPSLFSTEGIARILEAVNDKLLLSPDIEITLEANPGSSEQERFKGYRDAGVNRLSIGIQSFHEERLKTLGRIHGREEALNAANAARGAGFENFNLDLMYALPDQDLTAAAADLERAINLKPTHISYYQLTMEPGTHFHMHPPPLPDDELAWEMQLQGESMLATAGYRQYEVSAYAQAGKTCRHNLNYWQFGDYLGVGAGAHGKLTDPISGRIIRTAKQRLPAKYISMAGTSDLISEHRDVNHKDRAFEFLLNALRLKAGFSIKNFIDYTHLDKSAALESLDEAQRQLLINISDNHIVTTDKGWRHIDSILTTMINDSPPARLKLV